ncbi:unnamed protein product, partial [Tuber aestivum]
MLGPGTFQLVLKRADECSNVLIQGEGSVQALRSSSFVEDFSLGFPWGIVGWWLAVLFQENGLLHPSLLEVLMAYSMFRSNVGYVFGTHVVAGLLLLNLSPEKSFTTLVNLPNCPLPLAFYTQDEGAVIHPPSPGSA